MEDLFETPDLIPAHILEIIDKYCTDGDGMSYEDCENMIHELILNGYTADYGLDGVPFGLKKIE